MTYTKYIIGFVLSLMLTITAYLVVTTNAITGTALLLLLGGLALVQMIVQLIYFLHLDEEIAPRYRLLSFVFMAGVLVILVVGSIWIMQNLDYNMMNMSPSEKDSYMLKEHDKGF